jgi:hypothetical protein
MSFQEEVAQKGVSPMVIFGLALFVVFLILAAQYESWSLPFSVLLGTPIAVAGAFLALLSRRFENDTFAQIGLVMLIGLAAKNAILIVEFCKIEQERGKPLIDAALEGARGRCARSATAFAFILGVVPLVRVRRAPNREDHGDRGLRRHARGFARRDLLHPVSRTTSSRRLANRGKPAPEPPSPRRGPHPRPPPRPEAARGGSARARGCAGARAWSAPLRAGPDYHRPELVTPPTFRDAPEQQESIADLPWFEVFKDETLQGLVRESLEQNRDLATAIANMERSRDIAAVQRGQLFPQVGYTGIASRGKQASLGNIDTNNSTTSSVYAGVLNAAWELDIWGRIRRATEASKADMLASDAVRRGVVLSLVTGVAQAYLELRELDLELEIAHRNVESFQKMHDLFSRQFRGG